MTNDHPISLTLNINKIFMKITKNSLYKTLDQNQGAEQGGGFRKDFSTVDQFLP